MASEILQKCYFLCSVLAERKEYYLPAFKIGLYGLEMPRLPASTKPLEVCFAITLFNNNLNDHVILYYIYLCWFNKNKNYLLGKNDAPGRGNFKYFKTHVAFG